MDHNSATTSTKLINTNSKRIKKVSSEFLLTSVGLAWYGWLFTYTDFIGPFKLWTNESWKSSIVLRLNNPKKITF